MINALVRKIKTVLEFLRITKISSQTRGSILVEFAFALPILALTMYFGMDVPRAYRVSDRLHKMSELYAQSLLNVSKRRDLKALTMSDLQNISRATGLNITGTVGNKNFPFNLSTYVVCVKGKGDGVFEIKWSVHVQNNLESASGLRVYKQNNYKYSILTGGSTSLDEGSLKDFKIKKGELKLLIETVAWYSGDGRGFNNLFYLLSLPGTEKNSANTLGDKFAIVTPPDGLIGETLPSDPKKIVSETDEESTQDNSTPTSP